MDNQGGNQSNQTDQKFKSTDIYQTKAGVGAQYFPNQTNQKSRKFLKSNKILNFKLLRRILTIFLILLLLLTTIFVIYSLTKKPTEQLVDTDATAEVSALSESKDDILTSVHSTDDYQSFLQTYDDKISQTQTAAAQAYLYSLRASDILNRYYNDDPQDTYKDQAIADVLKAYELDPTPSAASDVAICYTWVGEPDLATQYYALAEQENSNETK